MTADAEQLPDLSARWMRGVLGEDIPRERRATCGNCAMCAPAGEAASATQRFFDPDVKCCSYYPILANFLVGQALADPDPVARASMEARFAADGAATPLGLGQPPAYAALYNRASNAFGSSKALICPHYVQPTGGCAIWRHRNAVCATWFCKFERGAAGSRFWAAVLRLLEAPELALARHCVVELDVGAEALAALTRHAAWTNGASPLGAAELDARRTPKPRALWGRWSGRERAFYLGAGEIVAGLSWEGALEIAGAEVRALSLAVQQQFAALRDEGLPARLALGPVTFVASGSDALRLRTYSEYDPLDLSHQLFEALRYFRGGSNEEAAAAMRTELGVSLEPDLVRKLVDFGVLKPADLPEN